MNDLLNDIEKMLPMQAWFNLHDVCELKNLNYKTACNRKNLQPNKGVAEGSIGGKKVWSRTTVKNWLCLTDQDIEGGNNE